MDDQDQTCYIFGDTIILPFDLSDDDVLNVQNVPGESRPKLADKHSTNKQGNKNEMWSTDECEMANVSNQGNSYDALIRTRGVDLSTETVDHLIKDTETSNQRDSFSKNSDSDSWNPEKEQSICREGEFPVQSFDGEGNFHLNNGQFGSIEFETHADKFEADCGLLTHRHLTKVNSPNTLNNQSNILPAAGQCDYSYVTDNTESFSVTQDFTPTIEERRTFRPFTCANGTSKQDSWESHTSTGVVPSNLKSSTNHNTTNGRATINNTTTGVLDAQNQESLQPPVLDNIVLHGNNIGNASFPYSHWSGGNATAGNTNGAISYDKTFYPLQSSGFVDTVNTYKVPNTQFDMPETLLTIARPYQVASSNERAENSGVFVPENYMGRMNVCSMGEHQPVYPVHPTMFPQADGRYSLMAQPGSGSNFIQSGINLFPQTQFYQPYIEQPYFMIDCLNSPFNAMFNTSLPHDNQSERNFLPQAEDSSSSYIFPQFNGKALFSEGSAPQVQEVDQSPEAPVIPKESQEDSEEARLQRVLSMERILRSEMPTSGASSATRRRSSSRSKSEECAQELDPAVRAEMQREEVANAAKAIFMKRTGTLFHWIHPGESKSELKSRVEEAWNKLSKKETNYYFSQVMGRCNSDFPTRPMVNPRLMELLSTGDDQKLAGVFNDDKGSQENETYSNPSLSEVSFKQRQRSNQRNSGEELSIPSGRQTSVSRLSDADHGMSSSNEESCGGTSSLSAQRRDSDVDQSAGDENVSSGRHKQVKPRGPRGPYKKTVRRLMSEARNEGDWESRTRLKRSRTENREGAFSEVGTKVVTKRNDTRGPNKKRRQESVRGRGRPPKRRMVSSEEESSTNMDEVGDPCVSRQCQSFSGKVKPSQELQEVLRGSCEAAHSDDWSSRENSPRRRKAPQRTRTRTRPRRTEAFLVDNEAMQMQFYREESSEDENKPEVELPSLPVTSTEVVVNRLRCQQGSASSSAHGSSGSGNSDVDWSPRQLRQTCGRSQRRGPRVARRQGRKYLSEV